MSKEQMLIARELIKDKKYDEARAILQNIDHPKAKEWLAKLDTIAPAKPQPRRQTETFAERAIAEDNPEAFLDELMARKRPAQRPAAPAKASKRKRKKPGFRYFLIYGLIFIIFLGGMLYAAVTYLGEDEDPDAQATSNAVETQNAEGLSLTATAAGNSDFLSTSTPESVDNSTPDPSSTEEP